MIYCSRLAIKAIGGNESAETNFHKFKLAFWLDIQWYTVWLPIFIIKNWNDVVVEIADFFL